MGSLICAGICLVICLGSILVISLSKLIIKKAYEKKQKKYNSKKYEYPFSLLGFVMTFLGVLLYLRFGQHITDYNIIAKQASSYALMQQSLYVFIGQAIRKGFTWSANKIGSMIAKLKKSKKPVEELPNIINDEVKNLKDEDTPATVDEIYNLYKNSLSH